MSTCIFLRGCMRSSTTKILSPYTSGILIFVPMGRRFVATIPSLTQFPEAVIKGVSSVCSGVDEYAVTITSSVFATRWGVSGDVIGKKAVDCAVAPREILGGSSLVSVEIPKRVIPATNETASPVMAVCMCICFIKKLPTGISMKYITCETISQAKSTHGMLVPELSTEGLFDKVFVGDKIDDADGTCSLYGEGIILYNILIFSL
jgi:hypothetical protein